MARASRTAEMYAIWCRARTRRRPARENPPTREVPAHHRHAGPRPSAYGSKNHARARDTPEHVAFRDRVLRAPNDVERPPRAAPDSARAAVPAGNAFRRTNSDDFRRAAM